MRWDFRMKSCRQHPNTQREISRNASRFLRSEKARERLERFFFLFSHLEDVVKDAGGSARRAIQKGAAVPLHANVEARLAPVDVSAIGLLGNPLPDLSGVVPAAILHFVSSEMEDVVSRHISHVLPIHTRKKTQQCEFIFAVAVEAISSATVQSESSETW